MKLDKTLNFKKVRCINSYDSSNFTEGKIYDVGAAYGWLKIRNDNGANIWYDMTCFEPVLEPAENPEQGVELTPEFEAVEPTFKVGEKVYFGFNKNIEEIERFCDFWDGVYAKSKSGNLCPLITCCHATQENYALLSQLYPHIKFEAPTKPLTGSDLARAMLDE